MCDGGMVSYGMADYGYGTAAAWDRLQDELAEREAVEEARDGARGEPQRPPMRHCYGNRSIWRPQDPTDPWSPLVIRPDLRGRELEFSTLSSEEAERRIVEGR